MAKHGRKMTLEVFVHRVTREKKIESDTVSHQSWLPCRSDHSDGECESMKSDFVCKTAELIASGARDRVWSVC